MLDVMVSEGKTRKNTLLTSFLQGHPNVSGHAKMSAVAAPIIKKTMNW
jgi:hypothetical protein